MDELGAEVAIGSIEDVPGLGAAMRGAEGGFVLCPPPTSGDPYGYANEVGSALAAAVRQARLPKVVALSSIGAQHPTGTGVIATLNSLEKHLEAAAPSTTFLRPGYFVESGARSHRPRWPTACCRAFSNEKKIPMVSTTDVGRTAAGLLGDDFTGKRIVELRGPQDWSANDVAAAFGTVLGRPVATAFVPPEARAAVLAEAGVPREVADALLGMYDGIASGRLDTEAGTEQRRGSVALADAVARMVRSMESNAGGLAA